MLPLSSNRVLCWKLCRHCVGKLTTCCTLDGLRYLLARGSSTFQQRAGVCGAAGMKSFRIIKAMLSEQGRKPLSFPPIICCAGFCVWEFLHRVSEPIMAQESLRQAVIVASAKFQHICIRSCRWLQSCQLRSLGEASQFEHLASV